MIVEVETVARLCTRNGVAMGSTPLSLAMRYTAQDPYACAFVFSGAGQKSVTWTFARDVLADGMSSREPVGELDVQCWRGLAPGLVWLRLGNGYDCAVFALDRADVARFVRRSYVLVRRGDESEHLDMDACVAALLEPKP